MSDTPSQESAELDVHSAASAFAELIEPSAEPEQKVDTELDPPTPKAEAEAEAEPEAESNAAEEGADATVTIEVDGKQVTLTKAQLAENYKNGLRQDDYTKKTMATAETRKAAEAETNKALQERAHYASSLQKMAAQLEGAIDQQAKIDWNALLEADPVEFLKQQHLSNQRQAALQQNQREQQALQQTIQAEQAEQQRSYLSTQQQELLAKLPQWKDEKTAKSEREALKTYLKDQGYDDGAINGISDHKAVILGRKAMLYDQMMTKAQAAAKKVANLPTKVERPGVSTSERNLDGRTAVMQRFNKSGSVDDMAAVFSSLL